MKSRRITILCVAMIALAGTPRALREVGKLIAVAQYKAQVKFWSMVLPSGERQSAGAEMLASAQSQEASFEEVASTCTPGRTETRENRMASSFNANRRTTQISAKSEDREQPQIESAPASHAMLIARASKAPRGDNGAESLPRSRNSWERQPTAIAGNIPASATMPGAATLPHPPASKSDTFRFVLAPPAPINSAVTEKDAATHFRLIKKSIEAGKLLRQKGRFPVVNGTAAFPSS